MFAENVSFHGGLSSPDPLYILKTIAYFEQLVIEEAADQRIPTEILRALKPCRACIIMSKDAFFCVLAFYGLDDSLAQFVHTEDHRPKKLDVHEAETLGVKHIIRQGGADPLTLRFPILSLDAYADDKRSLLSPLVQTYLTFEVSWAKQRGLLNVSKPFFPGQHFKVDPDFVFVLMPFAKEFDDIYSLCIKPAIEGRVSQCKRADEIFHNQPIVEVIWKHINEAALIVADLTTRNPNVFYEVGMAHTLGKEVVLLAQDLNDVPFDLRHLNVIRYAWTPPGAEKLKQALDATVSAVLRRDRFRDRERWGR